MKAESFAGSVENLSRRDALKCAPHERSPLSRADQLSRGYPQQEFDQVPVEVRVAVFERHEGAGAQMRQGLENRPPGSLPVDRSRSQTRDAHADRRRSVGLACAGAQFVGCPGRQIAQTRTLKILSDRPGRGLGGQTDDRLSEAERPGDRLAGQSTHPPARPQIGELRVGRRHPAEQLIAADSRKENTITPVSNRLLEALLVFECREVPAGAVVEDGRRLEIRTEKRKGQVNAFLAARPFY